MFQHLAVLLRAYNNNPGIIKSVYRAVKNGAGLVIVVVNASDESTRGNVRTWLEPTMSKHPGVVTIIEMNNGYSWSNALNVGFAHVRMHNRVAKVHGQDTIDYVVPTSVEVLWESEHLQAMLDTASQSREIGVVGTSFHGQHNGNEIDLGASYVHPRNTFMLISMEAFAAVGLFDAVCDGLGGMEDFHFLLSLILTGDFRWEMLDKKIKLVVGVNYDQSVKEIRERAAMRKIATWFDTVVADNPQMHQQLSEVYKTFNINI